MDFISKVWLNIESFFSPAEKDVVAFASALLHTILTNGGTLLMTATQNAVADAESTGGTGAEKLAAATASVTATLTANGVEVVLNAVNGAIEAAVAQQKLNGSIFKPVT